MSTGITSMALIFKHPKSKYWCASFYDSSGKRRNRRTFAEFRESVHRIAVHFFRTPSKNIFTAEAVIFLLPAAPSAQAA